MKKQKCRSSSLWRHGGCYKHDMLLFTLPAMGSHEFTWHCTFQACTGKQKWICHFRIKQSSKAIDRKNRQP